jgi:hypothetical protein
MIKKSIGRGDIKRSMELALAIGLVVSTFSSVPVFAADIPGTATVNNVAPEATAVAIKTMAYMDDNTLDPQTQYRFIVTVRDNNTLAGIENVVLKLYTNAAGENAADAVKNHYTFLFRASDNVWKEIGPGPVNSHLVTGSCVKPSDLSVASDNYVFVAKLSGAATATTGGGWTAKWIATDDNGFSGNNTKTFDVNEHLSLTIDDAKLTFSGFPGDKDVQPTENPTVATVTANYNFNIQCKLSGDLTGKNWGGTIPMADLQAARDVFHTSEIRLSDSYNNLWSNVGYGEYVQRDIYWFADIPIPLREDKYTAMFYIKAIKYT